MPANNKTAAKRKAALSYSEASIQRSNRIISWLQRHPLINKNGLCKAAGYSSASLSRVMSGNDLYLHIPAGYLDDLEKELRVYGYQ